MRSAGWILFKWGESGAKWLRVLGQTSVSRQCLVFECGRSTPEHDCGRTKYWQKYLTRQSVSLVSFRHITTGSALSLVMRVGCKPRREISDRLLCMFGGRHGLASESVFRTRLISLLRLCRTISSDPCGVLKAALNDAAAVRSWSSGNKNGGWARHSAEDPNWGFRGGGDWVHCEVCEGGWL